MRKFSSSLLAISFFIFTLCGCQSQAEPVKPNIVFESVATIKGNDITTQAKIVCASADDVSIEFMSPSSLKGLSYHKVNSTLYIEYNGLKCTTVDDYLTSFNPLEIIFDAVACVDFAKCKGNNDDNESLVFVGETPHGSIELYVDSESGNINRIEPSYTACEIELVYE